MFGILVASVGVLLTGLLAGMVFGFLLQKGGVAEFNVIVRQFLFTDFTVIKIMLTAIVVGGFGLYILNSLFQAVPITVIVLPHVGVLVGGLIFGVGMATLGLCPGTCVAAAGQGSRDAWAGLLGMFVGALLFIPQSNWINGIFQKHLLTPAATLGVLFGVSPFLLLAVLLVATIGLFMLVKDKVF